MSNWKYFPQDKSMLEDDKNYLVSWKDFDSKYSLPARAYWMDGKFFSLDTLGSFPINVDIFIEMPEVPLSAENSNIKLNISESQKGIDYFFGKLDKAI